MNRVTITITLETWREAIQHYANIESYAGCKVADNCIIAYVLSKTIGRNIAVTLAPGIGYRWYYNGDIQIPGWKYYPLPAFAQKCAAFFDVYINADGTFDIYIDNDTESFPVGSFDISY